MNNNLVTKELSVGLTQQMSHSLQIAVQFTGMKASTFGRQAILEKLCREKFMLHPLEQLAQDTEAKA
jgi:hypothetical protein